MQKLDGNGVTVMNVAYDPFGNIISGTLVGEYGFSTKPFVEGPDWYYYGFRYYDPVTGRWPSRDPIGEAGGVNLYSVVDNNPIGNFDYLGLSGSNCCGGKPLPKGKKCCGGKYTYNPNRQECCGSKIIWDTKSYCCKSGQKTRKRARWLVEWNGNRKACLRGACDMTNLLPGLGGEGRKFGFNPGSYVKDLAVSSAACVARAKYCDKPLCPKN
jgi:RHS repeat-associated protein